MFEAELGYNRENADDLLEEIKRGVTSNPPVPAKVDEFGSRFTVDIPMVGPCGSGVVRTGWIYKGRSEIPELTTLYVK